MQPVELNATVVEQTTALTLAGAGEGNLFGMTILLNTAAVTVDVTGFVDEDGDAKTLRFTGSTTADVHVNFPYPLYAPGALTVTSSVADKAVIYWRKRV